MPTVDVVRDGLGAASGRRLLAGATERGRGILMVWMESGEGVSLGRYHLDREDGAASRRATGGRVVRAGAGCARVCLALPHRSVFESDEPGALAPEQAMNRCVRGVLGGLETLGVDPSYPGRDVVTVAGRAVGWLSLTEEPAGAALFEAGLDLHVLARAGVAVDPHERAVEAIVGGYARRLGLELGTVAAGALPSVEEAPLRWDRPADAARVGELATMLGSLRVDVALDEAYRVALCRVSGDVIAPERTICEIEQAIVGVAALRGTIESAVESVLQCPGRWVLGLDAPRDIAEAVMQAVAP